MSAPGLPSITEYCEAVQNPHIFLNDPELKRCRPALNNQGFPQVWSGNFAAVFQLQSPEGTKFAIKCFYRDIADLDKRYAELDTHLRTRRPGYLVKFQYQRRGIRVGDSWFPIVRMEWVEGQTLDKFLEHQLQRQGHGRRELLEGMAQLWHHLAGELERDRIAHGDLQHGNVLFIPGNRPNSVKLRLVDYDGVWVPALDNLPSNESGQPNYQHPRRRYGPLMDRFPHLVIYTTLRCLLLDQQLVRRFSDQGLLFGQKDYEQPGRSELFRELWGCREPNTRHLVGHLILACVQPFEHTPRLQELVPEAATGEVRPLTQRQQDQVEEILRNGYPPPQAKPISVPFAGATSARPEHQASPALSPIPVPSATAPSDSEPVVQPSGVSSAAASPTGAVTPGTAFIRFCRFLAPVLAGTAVGCLVGTILAPLYIALLVLTPFLLLALCLRWEEDYEWSIHVVGFGALCATLALLLAVLYGWGWWLNSWWFGALLGLLTATGAWMVVLAGHARSNDDWPPDLVRSLLNACGASALAVLVLGWIPYQFAIRPPSLAASWYEARMPRLRVIRQQPDNGPILGEPYPLELEATSPVGRSVLLEWRYAGEERWQRLPEPKLHFPEVKSGRLALEFRAIDSKGFVSEPLSRQWEVSAEVRRFTGHELNVNSVAVTPDGRHVVSGSGSIFDTGDNTVRVWDIETGKEVRRFTGHELNVNSVAVTPDGRHVVSGSDDKTVRVWYIGDLK